MPYFTVIILIIVFSGLAYWKGNPVIFMLNSAVSLFAGLYAPDSLNDINYGTFGVAIGLVLIGYAQVNILLAFGNMFKGTEEEE